ncbi:hypothetical protein EDB89DRAFT_253633 [Lactarius sanguifluus]|nr:hypothetical protein EDB89DRAFT_253633 [Lactarius sanguifluus]
MFIYKRETQPRRCTTISSSIAVCWADLVVLSIVLLVLVYIFIGVPLTARLCKMFKGSRRCGYSRPSSTSSSMHHTSTRRSYSIMSPRRVGSEETLFDGLVDVGNDKTALVHDPFLVVQPSAERLGTWSNKAWLKKQRYLYPCTVPMIFKVRNPRTCHPAASETKRPPHYICGPPDLLPEWDKDF